MVWNLAYFLTRYQDNLDEEIGGEVAYRIGYCFWKRNEVVPQDDSIAKRFFEIGAELNHKECASKLKKLNQ